MSLLVSIKKYYKGFTLDANFEMDEEYLGILGASGSGKSMTLKCIAGIETPDEGLIILNERVLFDSANKINLSPQERNIGYLFQNYSLFPNMTAEQNIGVGLKLTKKEKKIKTDEIIRSFHLEGLENKYPSQLSGGQQQRVALARIFAYEPDVLLLDEPFSALDSHLKDKIQVEVLDMLKLYKGKVLMVTHSMDEVYRFCENLVVIDQGRTVFSEKTKELFIKPRHVAAARLTGCKNISRCNVLSKHSIYAADWDFIFETENIVPENINYVGIREHSFQMADTAEEKNTVVCKVNKVVEEVFDYIIMFENMNNKTPNENSEILFKVSKDEWNNRKNKTNLYLNVHDDSILMLK
jgi:molybdate transport system ATP-binding protein